MKALLALLVLASARAGTPLGPPKGLLSFEICGGLTNQRIALIEGLIIAQLTHRAVVLPALNPNGVQTGADYHEDRSRLAPFSTFYDVALTTERLARLGVKVAREWDAAWNATVPAAQRSALGAKDKMRRPDGSLPPPPTLEEEDPRLGLQMLSLLPDGTVGMNKEDTLSACPRAVQVYLLPRLRYLSSYSPLRVTFCC